MQPDIHKEHLREENTITAVEVFLTLKYLKLGKLR